MKVDIEFQELDRKKKIKRIIAREGLILLCIALIFFCGNKWADIRHSHYEQELIMLEKTHNIQYVFGEGRHWGGVWDKTSWDTDSKDPDLIAMVQVVDSDGNRRFLDKDQKSLIKSNGFDISTAEPVEGLSKEAKERLLKIFKSNEKNLRIAQRVVYLIDCSCYPPFNSIEMPILGLFKFIIFAYLIYAFVKIIIFITWLIKKRRLVREGVVKAAKIAFSKDVLIKVTLVLGIMFLIVSLLKSCGIISHRAY